LSGALPLGTFALSLPRGFGGAGQPGSARPWFHPDAATGTGLADKSTNLYTARFTLGLFWSGVPAFSDLHEAGLPSIHGPVNSEEPQGAW